MKLIYEQYLNEFSKIAPGLNPFGNLKDLLEFKHTLSVVLNDGKKSELDEQYEHALIMLEAHGSKNYVLSENFFNAIYSVNARSNIDKILVDALYPNEDQPKYYQLSTPKNHTVNYIIGFGPMIGDEFNIFLYRFDIRDLKIMKEQDYEGYNDFSYYIFRAKKGMTCQELFELQSTCNTNVNQTQEIFEREYNLWVNLLLYINSGTPDLRYLKAKKKPTFNPKKRNKVKKYNDVSFHDAILVGFNWKKEILVPPHFQGYWCGKGRTQYKVKFKTGHVTRRDQ